VQVLKLVETYSPQILKNIPIIGPLLDHGGSNGEIFSINNDTDKVIKLSAIVGTYDQEKKLDIDYEHIETVLDFIIINKPIAYMSVFDYKYLISIFDEKKQSGYIIYYYTMKKLNKTSSDERKVFHSVLSHEDNNIKKRFPLRKLKNVLGGLATALDFDMAKVLLFCKQINECLLIHNDIHPRNIMKDNDGNFKLIDIDSCTFNK